MRAKKEFASPEDWANCRADKLAPLVRKSAERQKLPKAGMIGRDRLLKIARAIWETISSRVSGDIDNAVKEETLKWAGEGLPKHDGPVIRLNHAINGKVQRKENW